MNTDANYWHTGKVDLIQLRLVLGDGKLSDINPIAENETAFYDTFDWRFWQEGLVLLRENDFYSIYDIAGWHEVSRQAWHGKKALRRRGELEDGDFSERFNSICGCRSLINIGEFTRRTATYAKNDAHSNPLCRLDVETFTGCRHKNSQEVGTLVRLRKLSRNPAVLRECEQRLLSAGFCPVKSHTQVLSDAFKLYGRSPGDYSMKINTVISAEMPCGEALVRLLQDNFRLMRCNEHGICKDIDIEFLHDYRVALRRSRTLLSSFDDLYSGVKSKEIKEWFSRLAQLTNPLRDCDVLLDYRNKYTAMLPLELRPGLISFFHIIEALRTEALQKVIDYFYTSEYEDFCRRWQKMLDHPVHFIRSNDPIQTVQAEAGKKIYSCFRKVVKGGRSIDVGIDADDTALHKVRIRCKKLRYLLEFFASIFPESAGDQVDTLKKLQTTLGDYNDMVVQIATLKKKIDNEHAVHRPDLAAAAAVGGLIALLARDKNELREDFKGCFNDFATSGNSDFFKEHFRREV